MYTVRPATLDDVEAICAVHRSQPAAGEWLRYSLADGRYHPSAAVPDPHQLNAFQQWMNGGPWMNPSLCAIHLNSLLLAGHLPLLVCAADQVVGELELFWDAGPEGLAGHIGVLQVRQDWQGRGAGRALVETAARIARERGCVRLTVEPADEARGFYARLGFSPWISLQALTLRTAHDGRTQAPICHYPGTPPSRPAPAPLDPVAAGWRLVLNYRQCPTQIWHLYGRQVFALPEAFFGPHPVAMVEDDELQLLLLLVWTPTGPHLYGWSPQGYQPRHLRAAARFLAHQGVTCCRTAVPSGAAWEPTIEITAGSGLPTQAISVEREETYAVWQLPLIRT